mmetsp:Transcript_103354/g.287755  ORF Transcript_103354/g.287755 Transcript_103354/m.287755 type:complete len:387 (-) Transcript_103354:207-1367(-)
MAVACEGVHELKAIELWRLPNNFFALGQEAQWNAIQRVTVAPTRLTEPRSPCTLTLAEETLCVLFFLMIFGIPLAIPLVTVCLLTAGSSSMRWWFVLVMFLAFHPIPSYVPWYRRNNFAVTLAKYFTMTMLIDRSFPEARQWATPEVEAHPVRAPCVPLACPHGVINFGAVLWVLFSRWICGVEQYTAGAAVVRFVPGLRYLGALLWVIPADRPSLKRALQEPVRLTGKDGALLGPSVPRRGGMVGVVPDGIAGIFKSRPGQDALFIGSKRGLMRICLEEGALIMAAWFSGTPELFRVVTDPFGIMEFVSRKLKVSLFLFYGRWAMPIPRRVPLTLCPHMVRCTKTAAPSNEEVERLHQEVYGGLSVAFQELRHYTGYPTRSLAIL